MQVPASVQFVADRLKAELFAMDGEKPTVTSHVRPHKDAGQGWVIETTIDGTRGMLPLQATVQRCGWGSLTWDLERNEIIITGQIDATPVSILIARKSESPARRFSKN